MLDLKMIKIYYASINDVWSKEELEEKMSGLSHFMQCEAMKYANRHQQQLTIAGKLLLQKLLNHFKLNDELMLQNLQFDNFSRPYFNYKFDFNISHSANIVVCAASITTKVGIDIEKIQAVQVENFTDYFTIDEINTIISSNDKYYAFYKTWTKKEAFIKAIGKGVHAELSTINTLSDVIEFDGVHYYLHPVPIEKGYICYLATTAKDAEISVTKTFV